MTSFQLADAGQANSDVTYPCSRPDCGGEALADKPSQSRPALHLTNSSWLNLIERWFSELTNITAPRRHTSMR
jgi:hypothetical protein